MLPENNKKVIHYMDMIKNAIPGKATGFIAEFKAFAMQGNLIDLAVGIVIGTAFNAIVNSLVNDIVMPLIALAFGKPDFSAIVLGPVKIGTFITNVVNFLIIALSVFVVLKFVLRTKKEESAQ
jgi:large conductance mechanosensitive channel